MNSVSIKLNYPCHPPEDAPALLFKGNISHTLINTERKHKVTLSPKERKRRKGSN